jgi:hypothetical protein
MGHSKLSVTLDSYSHEFEAAKRSEDIRARGRRHGDRIGDG